VKGLWLILGVLLLAARVQAEAPRLHYRAELGAEPAVFERNADLWVEAAGDWRLMAEGSPGVLLRDRDGQLSAEGPLLEGRGSYQGLLGLEFHCQLPFSAGSYAWEVELTLEQAQGVLGLELAGDYWILPLSNHEVEVERRGELIPLPSGRWLRLQAGDIVRCADRILISPAGTRQGLALQSRTEAPGNRLRWMVPALSLEAGDRAEVSLCLQGPARPSTLTLRGMAGLRLGSRWSLDGEVLAAARAGDILTVALPALSPGPHELTGSLQALLPLEETTAMVQAFWEEVGAVLDVHIKRSWFDHNHLQSIAVQDADSPLLLPGGRLTGAGSAALVPGGKLDVILPLKAPQSPIWTGLPLAEAVQWSAEPGEATDRTVVAPILIWDEGFFWRAAAWSDEWLLDAAQEGFTLKWGPLLAQGSGDRLAAALSWGNFAADGNWQWRQTPLAYHGSWQGGSWRWSVELPRGEAEPPKVSVAYGTERWRVHLASGDVRLGLSAGGWSGGGALQAETLWLQKRDGRFRVQISPKELSAAWKPGELMELNLTADSRRIRLDVQYPPWEGYLQHTAAGSELGLRFKCAWTHGEWQLLSRGAWQLKNGLVLGELGQVIGYPLTSWCTLYAEGVLSFGPSAACRTDLGVILTPRPYLVAAVGLDSQRGLHWKAGIVLPLLGRETPEQCE